MLESPSPRLSVTYKCWSICGHTMMWCARYTWWHIAASWLWAQKRGKGGMSANGEPCADPEQQWILRCDPSAALTICCQLSSKWSWSDRYTLSDVCSYGDPRKVCGHLRRLLIAMGGGVKSLRQHLKHLTGISCPTQRSNSMAEFTAWASTWNWPVYCVWMLASATSLLCGPEAWCLTSLCLIFLLWK